jgi:hypothetical protein
VSPEDRPDIAYFIRTARIAAKADNCATVAAIGDRVRKLAPTYYATVFATDPTIAACLPERLEPVMQPLDPPERRGLTFDVELGPGYVGYLSRYPSNRSLLEPNASASGSAGALMLGAGVGVLVRPRFAIGLRGMAAFSQTTDITYDSGIYVSPGTPLQSIRSKLSQEIVTVFCAYSGASLWFAGGFGFGRIDPGGFDLTSRAAYGGAALDLRIGVVFPYGFGPSLEVTWIDTGNTPPKGDPNGDPFETAQVTIAFVVGWQYR